MTEQLHDDARVVHQWDIALSWTVRTPVVPRPGALETLGTLGTLCALRTLAALYPLEILKTLGTLRTPDTLWTLRASDRVADTASVLAGVARGARVPIVAGQAVLRRVRYRAADAAFTDGCPARGR